MKTNLEYMIQRFFMCNNINTKLRYKNIIDQMLIINILNKL